MTDYVYSRQLLSVSLLYALCIILINQSIIYFYVAAKATYIRLLLWQNGGFSALAP